MTALNETTTAAMASGGSPDGDARPGSEITPVLRLLEELPPRQREVIRLKFHGGLSYRQIGEVMGLTVSHVGVLIHTALKTIRASLDSAAASGPINTSVSR